MLSKIWHEKRLGIDPNKYRVREYVLDVNVPNGSASGGIGTGVLVTDSLPFVLDFVTHMILTLPEEEQTARYSVVFRDDARQYNTAPTLATLLFGHTAFGSKPIPLTVPLGLAPSSSIIMDVDSHFTYPTFGDTYPLRFVLHGFERWQE